MDEKTGLEASSVLFQGQDEKAGYLLVPTPLSPLAGLEH